MIIRSFPYKNQMTLRIKITQCDLSKCIAEPFCGPSLACPTREAKDEGALTVEPSSYLIYQSKNTSLQRSGSSSLSVCEPLSLIVHSLLFHKKTFRSLLEALHHHTFVQSSSPSGLVLSSSYLQDPLLRKLHSYLRRAHTYEEKQKTF